MKKLIRRYRLWKDWRQYTHYGLLSQVLIFLKLKECTWFEEYWINGGKE